MPSLDYQKHRSVWHYWLDITESLRLHTVLKKVQQCYSVDCWNAQQPCQAAEEVPGDTDSCIPLLSGHSAVHAELQ